MRFALLLLLLLAASAHAAGALQWEPLNEPGSLGAITSVEVDPHHADRVLMGGDMLGIGLSEDRGAHWQSTFGLRSWEIGDTTWHPTQPDTVWAGTVSGPYVSLDGGRHWQERRAGFPPTSDGYYTAPIEKILFDPADERRLLAFGGSSRGWESPGAPLWGVVWESLDAGASWRRGVTLTTAGSTTDPHAKGGNIVSATFAAHGPGAPSKRVYAAVRGVGLLVSEDAGATWERRDNGLPDVQVERVVAHPTDPDTLFVCLSCARAPGAATFTPGGIFKSTDAGHSWHSITANLPQKREARDVFTSSFKAFDVCRAHPEQMITSDTAWDTGVVYVTGDGGTTWRAVATRQNVGQNETSPARRALLGAAGVETAGFAGLGASVAAIDPQDPNVLYAAGSEYLVRSLDGGRTWADMTAEKLGPDLWRGRGFSGLCAENVRWDPFTPSRLFILAMDAGKLWESRDDGRGWTFRGRDPWPWGGGNDVTFARDGTVYATTGQFGGNGSILRTTDGRTWQALSGAAHGLPRFEGGGVAEGVYTLPDNSRRVWCCFGGALYASEDGGEQWTPIPSVAGAGRMAGDPNRPARFYVSGRDSVWVTEDGRAFTPLGGPRVPGRMTVDRLGRLYVCAYHGRRGGLWRFTPTAADAKAGDWERLRDDAMLLNVAVDPGDARRLAVVANDDPYHDVCRSVGVMISADAGATWTSANDGLVMTRCQAIAFNPRDGEDVICGTQGRGFFRARWPRDFMPAGQRRYHGTADDVAFARVNVPAAPMLPKVDVKSPFGFRNGSMSDGDAVPTGWSDHWGTITVARDTTVFHTTPASLRVDSDGPLGQAFQLLQAPGGVHLKITGVIRCAGQAEAQCAVQAFDAGFTRNEFKQLKWIKGDTDWTPFTGEVTLPPWAGQFNIQLMIKGQGHAWLDDVTLTALGATP